MNSVQIMKISPDAMVPTYTNPGDAGADLYSIENVVIHPGNWNLIRTGIVIAIPNNWVGLVHPRSGLAFKKGVTVLNTPGTIDAGYRGEIMVNMINHGHSPYFIEKGDRIAQIVFQQVEKANFSVVETLNATQRGENGHGSSGGFGG